MGDPEYIEFDFSWKYFWFGFTWDTWNGGLNINILLPFVMIAIYTHPKRKKNEMGEFNDKS